MRNPSLPKGHQDIIPHFLLKILSLKFLPLIYLKLIFLVGLMWGTPPTPHLTQTHMLPTHISHILSRAPLTEESVVPNYLSYFLFHTLRYDKHDIAASGIFFPCPLSFWCLVIRENVSTVQNGTSSTQFWTFYVVL